LGFFFICSFKLFQQYFSANEQYFPLITNQHKHQHKPNFRDAVRFFLYKRSYKVPMQCVFLEKMSVHHKFRDSTTLMLLSGHSSCLTDPPQARAPLRLLASRHAPLHLAPRTVALDPPRAVCAPRRAPSAPCASHGHTGPTSCRVCPAPSASCRAPYPCLAPLAARRPALPRAAPNSLHWVVASRRAHVATVCFMRFSCMLHMFHLDVAKIALVLHMLQ
jgi:hypothetical protein